MDLWHFTFRASIHRCLAPNKLCVTQAIQLPYIILRKFVTFYDFFCYFHRSVDTITVYINTFSSYLSPPTLAMALTRIEVALVTGAAHGIGRAIALCLAHNGLDVTVNDKSSGPELNGLVREIESKGHHLVAIPADISQVPQVEKAVQKTMQDLGSLDVVGHSDLHSWHQ